MSVFYMVNSDCDDWFERSTWLMLLLMLMQLLLLLLTPERATHLIVFAIGVFSHHTGFLELTLERVHTLFIRDVTMFKHFTHTNDVFDDDGPRSSGMRRENN